jgi:uncharacterized protein YyaL (SSP411 family)
MGNRLGSETSPYLRQHADNPVDWQPWDDQAIDEARRLDKPILLSIGYSACHWCHVMAHESFEDSAIAAVMNTHFVNIKVDREERPDLDKIYQLAHQLLTQQTGGWPLTAFLDPETLLPFFAGTYFPKTPRYQLPGFADLLMRIRETFDAKRDELTEQGGKIAEVLERLNEQQGSADVLGQAVELIDAAQTMLAQQYDDAEGGYGNAPKFPMPGAVTRELRYWALSAEEATRRAVLERVMTTLTRMARGGIYDHVGGGFFRYATDRKWMIPHFEKMLYDNGQLLRLYAEALAVSPDQLFEQAVTETAEWMIREMRHPDGGFYAALDADSEGEEGRFYLWRRDQVKKLLDPTEYLLVETLYGLDKPANFEGKWNFHRRDAWRSVVERLSLSRQEADSALASAKAKLFAERSTRVRPGLDDKILTAWNGLAITGLACAGSQLGRRGWVEAAQQCADFLREQVWIDGRLMATWTDGRARFPGYLDDYANLLNGLLALLAADWRQVDAEFAFQLAETVISHFHDEERGGFFFTAHDHESLIYRPKPTMDDAQPPGNGVLAEALIRLGHLFGEPRYLEVAHRTLVWAGEQMVRYPAGHCSLISALELDACGAEQIIIRGATAELDEWLALARAGYHPGRASFAIPWEVNVALPGYLPRLVSADTKSRTLAYRCRGMTCSAPIESLEAFRTALAEA